MKKSVIVGALFFILGFGAALFAPGVESRLAFQGVEPAGSQQISFERIKVFHDRVLIDEPGIKYAQVKSGSMAPLIVRGSTVLEKEVDSPFDIQLGDIISFYEPSLDDVVLHQVIEIIHTDGEVFFGTKGTANPYADAWVVPFENIKGVLVGVIR